jgi:hypothetical protein
MLKQAVGDEAMSRTQTHEWYNILKRAELQSRTMNVQDNLRHPKIKKTFKKFKSNSSQLSFDCS